MLTTLLALAIPLSVNAQAVSDQDDSAFSRSVMLENKVQLPSNTVKTKVIRVTLPVNFKTPEHTHEGPGPRFVAKGKLKVIEGDKTNTYGKGQVFWESGELMTVENIGHEPAELIIFELAPAH